MENIKCFSFFFFLRLMAPLWKLCANNMGLYNFPDSQPCFGSSQGTMVYMLDSNILVNLNSSHAIRFTFGLISLGKVWTPLSTPCFYNDGFGMKSPTKVHMLLKESERNLIKHREAFVQYSSKDESLKAQKALNTCVVGNTTILAEFVSECEATQLVEQSSTTMATPTSTSQWSQSSQITNPYLDMRI